jgi:PAS domain S-box-containing protein
MDNDKKTKKQLVEELNALRNSVAELKGFKEEIEQTRVNQEKFAKAFLQNSVPASITTLKEGRFIDVSNVFLRLTGYKRDEVIGHTSTEIGFITEEQRVIFFNELNKKGRIENLEMKVRTKGGALRDGLFNAVMMSLNNEKYLLAVITDITDRKSMERALAEEHQRLLSILDGSPVSSFVIDRDHRVTAWNRVNIFFTGISKEDILGKPLDISPLFKDKVPPTLADLVLEMSDEEIMKRFGHKGIRKSEIHPQAFESIGSIWIKGKEHILAIQATRLRDTAGNVVGAIQCAQDITEQQRFEQTLRKNEHRLHMIVEHVNDAFYIHDFQGNITDLNDNACRMVDYTREELLAPGGFFLIDAPMDSELTQGRLSRLLRDGFIVFEGQHKRKDGKMVEVNVSARIVSRDGNGIVQSFVSDITGRKRTEEILKQSEEKHRMLMENASDAILITDPNGNILQANIKAEEFLGYTKEDLLQMNYTQIHPKDELEKTTEAFKNIMKHGRGFLHNGRILRKDEKEVPVDITGVTIQYAGQKVIYGSFRDITEQKNAKDTLERLVKERTAEVNKKNRQLVGEIKKSKSAEATLRQKGRELNLHSIKLQQLNAALKVLLKQRDEDRRELEEKVLSNVKHLINPTLETLKKRKLDPDSKTYLDILEQNLKNIISPFSHTLSSKYQNLTSTEIKVANMIRGEKTTKEMAEFMGVSESAINHHRYHIRSKLGILTQKINLRSHLLSMS